VDVLSSALKRFELCTKDATCDLEPVSEELEKRLAKLITKKKSSASSSYLKLHRALIRSGVHMGVWDLTSSTTTSENEKIQWTNDITKNKRIQDVLKKSTSN
jgi:hypothetical protein